MTGRGRVAGGVASVVIAAAASVAALAAATTASSPASAAAGDAAVWAWGDLQSTADALAPTAIATFPAAQGPILDVVATRPVDAVLGGDGVIRTAGTISQGNLGRTASAAEPQTSFFPVAVPAGHPGFRAVGAGEFHLLAAATDGTVWGWGANGQGQAAPGEPTGSGATVAVPTQVALPTEAASPVQLEGGRSHSLVLDEAGQVWGWGSNGSGSAVGGQVGDGVATPDARLVPVRVAFPAGVAVRSIGTGLGTSYAVDADGRLWGWGQADDGALGPGVTSNQVAPVLIGGVGDARFTQVVGTYRSAFALDDAGQVWAWGGNQDGQLGDGTTTGRATPAVVAGIDGPVARIARMTADCCPGASAGHIAVLTAAGDVWTWGLNNRGQLGDGTTDGRATPAKVAGLDDLEVSGVVGGDGRTLVWSNPASEPPDPTDPPVTGPTVPPTGPTVPPTGPPVTGPTVPPTGPPATGPTAPAAPAVPLPAEQVASDDDIPRGELARTGDHDAVLGAIGMVLVVLGAVVLVERGRRFRQG